MKNSLKIYKLLFLIPGFLTCILDSTLTIVNQPAAYWTGQLNAANEANPLVFFMMENHILGIFIATLLWLILMVIMTYFLPYKLSKIFSLGILMGHTGAASSWISYFYGFGYVIVLVIINSVFFIIMEELYFSKLKKSNSLLV